MIGSFLSVLAPSASYDQIGSVTARGAALRPYSHRNVLKHVLNLFYAELVHTITATLHKRSASFFKQDPWFAIRT
jgi:hypothetical protein